MALVLEDGEVCNSWEDIEENAALLEKQLARLKVNKDPEESGGFSNGPSSGTNQIKLDSTTEESLRSQYVPPEPKLTILTRPKGNRNAPQKGSAGKAAKPAPAKTLQQREEEYAAARMRILGDVRFEAEEAEAELEASLSPAEILKLKVAEAIRGDAKRPNKPASVQNGVVLPASGGNGDATAESQQVGTAPAAAAQNGQPRRNKRSREKVKTVNPAPQRELPVLKTESDRIIRHPRGPDGSAGFNNYRS